MNYLAHLYLSDPDDLHLLGNVAGDWIKGSLRNLDMPPRLLDGVRRHRWVDSATDGHPAVREAHRLFSPHRRRAVPIIMDMVFDHCLAVHWDDYARAPLDTFLEQSYEALYRTRAHWPEGARERLPVIIERDLLRQYGDLAVIGRSLERIAGRLSRDIGLGDALPEIRRNISALEAIHHTVLTDLRTRLSNPGKSL